MLEVVDTQALGKGPLDVDLRRDCSVWRMATKRKIKVCRF